MHIHFGAGRLGLGLVAPFFQGPGSELYLLNRAVSGSKETGSTALTSQRRNELLQNNPEKFYVIRDPGTCASGRHVVRYDGFFAYDDDTVGDITRSILAKSTRKQAGVIVTASVLKACNYCAVLQALALLAEAREQGSIGPLFFVACENTLSAHDVFQDCDLIDLISGPARRHVTCVHALVDRMCVGLEEDRSGPHPTVLVRAEQYGSVKLELGPETEALMEKLAGTRVEFSRHVAVEKQVKSWLLNGSHWLIALAAFQESQGNRELKLNEFLRETPERERFASTVMKEMRDGVAAILRGRAQYTEFVRDIDPDQYLDGAARAIIDRFLTNEDPITRILARFQAPSPGSLTTIEAFSKRFSDRVDEPINAYEADKGVPPLAAMHSMRSLVRLIASGSFINAPRA